MQGTHRYATGGEVEEGELTSTCTCLYWDACKQAVAELRQANARKPRLVEILDGLTGRRIIG